MAGKHSFSEKLRQEERLKKQRTKGLLRELLILRKHVVCRKFATEYN